MVKLNLGSLANCLSPRSTQVLFSLLSVFGLLSFIKIFLHHSYLFRCIVFDICRGQWYDGGEGGGGLRQKKITSLYRVTCGHIHWLHPPPPPPPPKDFQVHHCVRLTLPKLSSICSSCIHNCAACDSLCLECWRGMALTPNKLLDVNNSVMDYNKFTFRRSGDKTFVTKFLVKISVLYKRVARTLEFVLSKL